VTYLTPYEFDNNPFLEYNSTMAKKKRTPEQREAIKRAYWNKWGGDPEKVLRTKGITNDVWYTITNVTNITFDEFDNATGK
jgi:hypothetical protein